MSKFCQNFQLFSNFWRFFQMSKYFPNLIFFQNFKYVICQYFHFQFQFANYNGSHKLLGFVDAQVLCIRLFSYFNFMSWICFGTCVSLWMTESRWSGWLEYFFVICSYQHSHKFVCEIEMLNVWDTRNQRIENY